MNNYSFQDLTQLLSLNNIKDASELHRFIDEFDAMNDTIISSHINSYIKEKDITSKTYNRQILYSSDKYNVILIFWNPQSESPIHCHPKKGCLMKVLKGILTVDIYDDSDYSTIQHLSTTIYREHLVTHIRGEHGIHKITNDSDELSITLHIYINNKA
jgi:predicted metal-dependent enzyme (double-stranded beta helix superfamily)